MSRPPRPEDEAAYRELCRRRGWRSTAQRRAVFAGLRGLRNHPGVEAVWRRARRDVPDISLDSVYRILDDFAEAGAVRRLSFGKLIRYDTVAAPHHHFQCSGCGRLFDFDCGDLGPVADACAAFAARGAREGFALTVHGRCRACGPAPEEGTGTAEPSA